MLWIGRNHGRNPCPAQSVAPRSPSVPDKERSLRGKPALQTDTSHLHGDAGVSHSGDALADRTHQRATLTQDRHGPRSRPGPSGAVDFLARGRNFWPGGSPGGSDFSHLKFFTLDVSFGKVPLDHRKFSAKKIHQTIHRPGRPPRTPPAALGGDLGLLSAKRKGCSNFASLQVRHVLGSKLCTQQGPP